MKRMLLLGFLCLALISLLACLASADTAKVTIRQTVEFGYYGDISGTVSGVTPADYYVFPVIYIPGVGWWTKPTFATPYITINANGSWSGSVFTNAADNGATLVNVYLIPKTSYPACYSQISGSASVPDTLVSAAVASDRIFRRGQHTINWSGMEWIVKESNFRVGPGSNYFVSESDCLWVDGSDNLHMRICKIADYWTWYCPEIYSASRLGYGTYKFTLASRVDELDPRVVLGLFTWSDFSSPNGGNREIDIEYSKWGNPANQAGQFVVQPVVVGSSIQRFAMTSAEASTQTFVWRPGSVNFESRAVGGATPICSWAYTTNVPSSLDERVHLNLWLNNNVGPSDGLPAEVIISKFEFEPWQDPTHRLLGTNSRMAADSITTGLYDDYHFRFFGRVIDKDCFGLTLDDGGPNKIRVLDPGHTFSIGDYIAAGGVLSGTTTKQLDSATERITLIKE